MAHSKRILVFAYSTSHGTALCRRLLLIVPSFVLPVCFHVIPSAQAKLADSLRQLEGSKAIEDALQSELNTTLAAYAQSKEGNQKLIQVGDRAM